MGNENIAPAIPKVLPIDPDKTELPKDKDTLPIIFFSNIDL